MEDLDHVECDERHHHALFVGGARNHVSHVDVAHVKVHARKEACQHKRGNNDALHNAVEAHVTSKNAVGGLTRLALHNVALSAFHTQRQRREAVGDQVYPQQLHRLEQRKAHERGDKDREDLGKVCREQELNDLADVVVDAAALFARRDDGGKVVVSKHHVSHVLGNVGARDAHTYANVGALDGRSVIHAVARHGNNHVAALPSLNNARLVLRLHACVNAVVLDVRVEFFVGHAVQLGARDGLAAVLHHAQVFGDGHGGIDVIARNHDGTDTRGVRLLNGSSYLGAFGVNHARETAEGKVVLKGVGRKVRGLLGVVTACQCQHAQGLVGHSLVSSKNLGALLVSERHYLLALKDAGTAAKHHIGAALGVLLKLAVQGLHHNRHHLAARVEGRLAHARVLLGKASHASLSSVVYQRALSRFAHSLASFFVPLGIGAKRHTSQQILLLASQLVLNHGHLILGQRARLVRANHLRTAQGLNGREVANDSLALGHLGHAKREHDGDHCHQTLRDGSNSQ